MINKPRQQEQDVAPARRLKGPQRREQLLNVATRLFAKGGFDATTTAAIAKAARVTEPVLYRHFASKQALFVAIVRRMSEQTLQYWQEVLGDEQDPMKCLSVMGRSFPDQLKKLEAANHVLQGALASSQDRQVQAVIREHFEAVCNVLADIIKRGQEQGSIRSDLDAGTLAWQFAYIGLGYAMLAMNLKQAKIAGVNESMEFMLRGLRP